MNPDLMILVERIVRPVAVRQETRLRMREELYDLLEQIYAEELAVNPDGALVRAAERLGPAKELQQEFQATVSSWERWSVLYERWLFPRGPLTFWQMLRAGAVHTVLFGVPVISAMLPLTWWNSQPAMLGFFVLLSVLFGVLTTLCLLVSQCAVGADQQPFWRQAKPFWGWCKLSLATGVMVASFLAATRMLYWFTDPVAMPMSFEWGGGLCVFGGALYAFVIVMMQYERELYGPWEQLELG